jgi:hypothetical protein
MLDKLRYAAYRFKYTNARALNLETPVDVSVELAAVCQSRCSYCYWNDASNLPFKTGMMSKSLASKILHECKEFGVHSFKTNFRGESTLNPHFEEITSLAKSLASGGTLIDRITNSNFQFRESQENVFRGLCNQTKVKVSFDSFRKEIYEKQRTGSLYDRAIRNIDKFYNYPGRDNELVVQAVRTTLNADEDLEGEIKRRWPSAKASVRDVVEGRLKKDISESLVKTRDFSDRQPCVQAFARVMIRWDGSTGACCPDISGKIVIGDANKQTIKEIFQGQEAERLRKSLLDKTAFDLDPCKTCSSHESFKGYEPPWQS